MPIECLFMVYWGGWRKGLERIKTHKGGEGEDDISKYRRSHKGEWRGRI